MEPIYVISTYRLRSRLQEGAVIEMLIAYETPAAATRWRPALIERHLHAAFNMSGQAFVRHTSPNAL
jgi:hypothetical protein